MIPDPTAYLIAGLGVGFAAYSLCAAVATWRTARMLRRILNEIRDEVAHELDSMVIGDTAPDVLRRAIDRVDERQRLERMYRSRTASVPPIRQRGRYLRGDQV